MVFDDRLSAGRLLARELTRFKDSNPVILALPRGGVPVASAVAEAFEAPLDVIIVRKLGVPFQPELGMGAIGEDGVRVLNDDVLRLARVSEGELHEVEKRERAELSRRIASYRGGHPMVPLEGRTVMIVDDGIATGGTMKAAIAVARAHGAARVVVAVPVAARATVAELALLADDVVALDAPEDMIAIGYWYRNFRQTSDTEVVALLSAAGARVADAGVRAGRERDIDVECTIPVGRLHLSGYLCLPKDAQAIVVFAHGSGSSRHSPRNHTVADVLHARGLGTLLFDLLTTDEEVDRSNVFDVELLGRRLHEANLWLRNQPETDGRAICYFGASTGAAAALWAAAEPGAGIAAVVSRGGRPDLARERLGSVRAPVLLIVGSLDRAVEQLNRDAARQLRCEHRVEVVAGASHLFEEPGTLTTVARLAADWILDHVAAPGEVTPER